MPSQRILYVDEKYDNYGIVYDPDKIRRNGNLIDSFHFNKILEKLDDTEEIATCLTAGRFLCLITFSSEKKSFMMVIFDCENNEDILIELLKRMCGDDPETKTPVVQAFYKLKPVYNKNYDEFSMQIQKKNE